MSERRPAPDDPRPASAESISASDNQSLVSAAPEAAAVAALAASLPPTTAAEPPKLVVAMPVAKPVSGTLRGEDLDTQETAHEEAMLWHDWWQQVPSWLASTVFHLVLVLFLALITTMPGKGEGGTGEEVALSSAGDGNPEGAGLGEQMMEVSEILEQASTVSPEQLSDANTMPPMPMDTISPTMSDLPPLEIAPVFSGGAPRMDNLSGIGNGPGTGRAGDGLGSGDGTSLDLRLNTTKRGDLLRTGGGTAESEQAVALALQWLSEHQNYDGSWTFQHQKSPKCHGTCQDPGSTPGKNAATAMALLPFFGTGQTHLEGQYRRTIDLGLKFLVRSMAIQGELGSLNEPGGDMYGHGLCAIALCEAYGMTHDRTLEKPAQMAVNFIVEAQDPQGGGWRYQPQQPGDTSVVGWQLMALRSAQLSYLKVPPLTLRNTSYFLNSVQADGGSTYFYQPGKQKSQATTAIGLLCRMYLGWKHDDRTLLRGVQQIATLGPSTNRSQIKNNMYYNYYATQVMHHYGGSFWPRWNEIMREYLISTQSQKGHEKGSWFFEGADYGESAGGRLYFTSLAAMTLEVYYRYMPLYRDESTNFNR